MNLALALNVRDPREFREWPAVVICLWLTYFTVQPYGNLAEDIRTGIATMKMVGIHVDSKSKHKIKLSDFVLGDKAKDLIKEPEEDVLIPNFR